MPKIWVLNGPNLNLLGTREPAVYGSATLADVEAACRQAAKAHGARRRLPPEQPRRRADRLAARGRPQPRRARRSGVVLNAGAYTHTSVALGDAIKAIAMPVIEVHLSNVHAREPFRHHSYLSPACAGIVVGFGVAGYALAIDGLARTAKTRGDARR